MDQQQFPKWHSVERRNEILQTIKGKLLTREGAVLTAIGLVALIALVTGTFYVVKNRDANKREALEAERLEKEKWLNEQAVRLPEQDATVKKEKLEEMIDDNAAGIPEEQASEREKNLSNMLGQ
jgi:flagellar biosynthesis/type III secretory pathway M-ring protein FliF/YscJ